MVARKLRPYLFAILITAAAFGLRWVIGPLLDFRQPFMTFFPAAIGVAAFAGLGPAVVSVALGALFASLFLVPPSVSLHTHLLDLAAYAVAVMIAVVAVEARRRESARRIASERRGSYSERMFAETFENANVGMAHVGLDGRWLRVNNRLLEILGYRRDELEKKTFQDVTHPDDLGEDLEQVRQLLSGEIASYSMEKRYFRKSGEAIWVKLSVALLRDETGAPERFITAVEDINERKRLERGQQLTAQLLNFSHDAIITADADRRILSWNRGAEELYGWTEAEVKGKRIHDLLHSESETGVSGIDAILRARGRWDGEMTHVRRDGERVMVESRQVSIENEGGAGILEINRDITSRKRTEEALRRSEIRLRTLSDANVLGIAIVGMERIHEANDYFLNMTGYTREDLAAGALDWRKMTPAEWAEVDQRALKQFLESGSCAPFEKEYFRKDGSRVPVLAGGATMQLEPDPCFMCFFLDLSERKRMEEQLRETQKLESVGLLAGGIAHDFNNLLTGIIGNASLALEDARPAQKEMLEGIIRSGERAAGLTRQLLAYAGKGQFVVSDLDLPATLEEMSGLLRGSVRRNIEFVLAAGCDVPPVRGDESQIQQIALNLVMNAAEAIGERPDGRVTVRTDARHVENAEPAAVGELRPGSYAVLSVSDNGPGMDAELQKKIFDPFFTTRFTGRGLGLAAAAGIVRSQRGAIRVRSAPGQGATFEVWFPARRGAAGGRKHTAKPTVLVIDDEQVVRTVLERTLAGAGYRTLIAASGDEAVALLKRDRGGVDVVLLDAVMPGMPPCATLDELRKLAPGAKFLLMSGFSEDEVRRMCRGEHCAGFVPKPFSPQEVLERVRDVLRDIEGGAAA